MSHIIISSENGRCYQKEMGVAPSFTSQFPGGMRRRIGIGEGSARPKLSSPLRQRYQFVAMIGFACLGTFPNG